MSKENSNDNKVMTIILPGEQVASIEEFEGGKNTYLTEDGTIRAAAIGTKALDLKRRVVKIEPKNAPMLPKIGDILVGYVEMIFASMISVKVLYINGVESTSGFSAIASMRVGGGRDRRERPIFRTGDIIRGRVMSLLNSTVHMTIAEREFGVLYTTCFMCGGDTVKVNDTVKCIECGAWEPRKLTDDYGKETLRQIFRAGGK
ncbi:exosome complex RNA-binding protein Csl4 [Nitrososphaera viennensis]|uniref:Exosome complex component Csl4 n=2 Tax=Nitrososphaera viennensis TaxID=1034015 RepID=A0A060HSZ7_9ARCH|nr:exosome complex RNA-binding protein Csl4 [Nitrososphaera viennensis]AIC16606.1 putative RNA-binding protein [Nitrososphaera viennensis EN76]UVS68533.1 exosome complex RNA-binding protein Csl4 [Nitrososphaera viennensis]